MLPKTGLTGRNKHDNLSGESDFSSISDNISSKLNEFTKTSRASSRQKDAAGDKRVRCRFCLKVKSKKRTLKRHVKRNHKALYDRYSDKGRSYFVADPGQMIPEDPDCVDQPPTIQKIKEPPVEKRQKLVEAEFNEFASRLTLAL